MHQVPRETAFVMHYNTITVDNYKYMSPKGLGSPPMKLRHKPAEPVEKFPPVFEITAGGLDFEEEDGHLTLLDTNEIKAYLNILYIIVLIGMLFVH